MIQEQEILVYADIDRDTVCVGRLFARARGRNESASFAYDPAWLKRRDAYAIDPELPLCEGAQHTRDNKPLFGAFGDCAPDRWGRKLMARAERRRARQVKETPRTLREADYLLRVNDYARQGALRFCLPQCVGVFQAPSTDKPIPPLVNLASLLSAAAHVETDTDTIEDLRLLLQPGSSLGGARPKASVLDANGKLAVAKFPSDGDDYNLVRWEGVALALAAKAGIQVPDWRIEPVAGKDVLLLTRFDRQGSARVPYQSAMTMLGASDNEDHSYLEIADCLNRFGANPAKDKAALWRRIVFNILITNTDDHLRNHGFLRESGLGWQLSPAFDMNPVPTDIGPRFLRTAVGIDDDEASLVLALEQADYFQLGQSDAKRIAAEVGAATAQWRDVAKRLGIAAIECQRMASAFEHTDLEHALALHRQPGRAS